MYIYDFYALIGFLAAISGNSIFSTSPGETIIASILTFFIPLILFAINYFIYDLLLKKDNVIIRSIVTIVLFFFFCGLGGCAYIFYKANNI